MADLLPSTPDVSPAEEAEPRVVGVDSDDADELLSALSSATARELLAALHEDPANPAALADRVDTSLQNTQYHLSNLEDAGLVDVVDTAYSEKGREMNVYAPTDRPLVVYAGKDEETSGIRAALSRLLGAVGALAVGSAVVETLFTGPAGRWTGLGDPGDDVNPGGAAGGTDTATPTAEAGQYGGAPEATPAPTGTPVDQAAEPTATQVATDTVTFSKNTTEIPEATATATETPTATPTATPTETAAEATRTATETATSAPDMAAGLPPGLVFFAGGCLVLAVLAVWQYRSG